MIGGAALALERGPIQSAKQDVGSSLALEQRQDALGVRIGDRQRLDAELLLHLQRLQPGRFLVHVGVDELADAAVDGVHQDRGRALLQVDALLGGAERRSRRRSSPWRRVDDLQHLGDLRVVVADDGQRGDGVAVGGGDRAGWQRRCAVLSRTPEVPRRTPSRMPFVCWP